MTALIDPGSTREMIRQAFLDQPSGAEILLTSVTSSPHVLVKRGFLDNVKTATSTTPAEVTTLIDEQLGTLTAEWTIQVVMFVEIDDQVEVSFDVIHTDRMRRSEALAQGLVKGAEWWEEQTTPSNRIAWAMIVTPTKFDPSAKMLAAYDRLFSSLGIFDLDDQSVIQKMNNNKYRTVYPGREDICH